MIYAEMASTATVLAAAGGGLLWLTQTTLAPLRGAVDRLLEAERS